MKKISLGNVLILGDSYSAFRGYIPENYQTYYSTDERPDADVKRVEEMWWHQLFQETESCLVFNDSWAATTICNTGYDGPNAPDSFIRRFERLVKQGFFEKNHIDTILVLGGQNDDWCNAPIGELKMSDWNDEDLLQFAPAVCYLMHKMKCIIPSARIIFIVNSEMKQPIMDMQYEASVLCHMECVRLNEIHKMCGHPTVQGMQQIAVQVKSYIHKFFL